MTQKNETTLVYKQNKEILSFENIHLPPSQQPSVTTVVKKTFEPLKNKTQACVFIVMNMFRYPVRSSYVTHRA